MLEDVRDAAARPNADTDAPWDWRMVESRERPDERPGRPRAFLAMRISSKSRMEESVAGVVSRLWINSLKAFVCQWPCCCVVNEESRGVFTLSVAHHGGVLLLIVRQAPYESIHVKGV